MSDHFWIIGVGFVIGFVGATGFYLLTVIALIIANNISFSVGSFLLMICAYLY